MPGKAATRCVPTRYVLAFFGVLATAGCAAKYTQVAPRMNLEPYGRIALVTFSSESADSGMTLLATQRFAEELLANQGIEVLELGPADSSLRALINDGDGSALAQALGREKNVPAVFVGRLKVSDVRPRGRVGGSGLSLKATVSAELTIRLLSTSTGGTVWRGSSAANGTVGRMHVSSGLPSIAVRDPEEAYGEVVRVLVGGVTRDFRPTWIRQ